MIPSDFKFIEKMPLNQNGKADKKELEKVYLER
jgi:non-ribosomal peptide synthetase component E (peptide arylation enzyme)